MKFNILSVMKKEITFIKNLSLDLKGNTLILFSRVETHGEYHYLI
jgi:16S rRNA G527 N7-methylase RsmG